MAIDIYSGTATLNATLGAGGVTPSVTVTSTLTSTNPIFIRPHNVVKDVSGPISLSAEYTSSGSTGTFTVSADRQIPAGEEIVFSWVVLDGTES
jgi:hypothetical protein